MHPSFNVLFLCTHNAARSIMAEAILNKLAGDRFRAYSAGDDPAERPNDAVMQKLADLGFDTGDLRSKSWQVFAAADAPRMDFVIALCDTTRGQKCPEFSDVEVSASWPLPDPAKFAGSDGERGVLLNQLYSSITTRLEIFASLPFDSLDRMALKARLDELGVPEPAEA